MSEEQTTTTTSESGSESADAGTSGEGKDGGAGGTADAEKFAAEREALQREARVRQSEADKAKAELAKAQAEIERMKGASGDETPTTTTPAMTPEQVAEQVRQAMRREEARSRELAAAVETAKEQYPNARPGVLDTSQYETAEEFLVAAKASHDEVASHVDAVLAKKEEELRAQYAAKYGELPAPPSKDQGTPTGDPTIEQLSSMTVDQLEALEKRAPGTIDRVLRSADQLS